MAKVPEKKTLTMEQKVTELLTAVCLDKVQMRYAREELRLWFHDLPSDAVREVVKTHADEFARKLVGVSEGLAVELRLLGR